MPFQKGNTLAVNKGRGAKSRATVLKEQEIDPAMLLSFDGKEPAEILEMIAKRAMAATDTRIAIQGANLHMKVQEMVKGDTDSKMSSLTRDIVCFLTQMMVANEMNCPDLLERMTDQCLGCKELRGTE